MTLTKTTTHETEAQARLVQQFKDSPDFAAWLAAYVEQIQDLEDVYFDLLLDRAIDTAVGEQLDGLGSIVGEDRKGKDDDTYRLWIKARRLVNKSSGTAPQLIEILDLLTTNAFEYRVEHPAAFSMIVDDILALPSEIAQILGEAAAAGVAVHLNYADVLDTAAFTFATADAVEASATLGWADDTPVTQGGFWIDVLEIA